MKLTDLIYSESLKVRHTVFGFIHITIPLVGAALFIAYYMLYANVNNFQKLNLILEISAAVFPLLISIVIGLNISLEEKTAYFYSLLAFPNRCRLLLAKLIVLYGTGIISLCFMFFVFLLGADILDMYNTIPLKPLITAVFGIAITNLIIYILHLFLNLKFSLGVSLFWGVFESLQCILYSNIRLHGTFRYLPFSWSMNWIHDIRDNTLLNHKAEWLLIVGITFLLLLLTIQWFSHWEGRKVCD